MAVALTLGGSVLAAFLQVLFDRMATPEFINSFPKRKNDEQLLENLKRNLNAVEAVLDDAENKQTTNNAVKKWLDDLHDTFYEAKDLLDKINTEALRLKIETEYYQSPTNKMSASTSVNDFLNNIRPEVEKVIHRLVGFTQDAHLRLLQSVESKRQSYRPPSTSLVDEATVFGRDADIEKIIQLLLSEDANGGSTTVVPIVGTGGIGKTTLAQMVYKDGKVNNHFSTKAWVCVSEEYDATRITKELLGELNISFSDSENLNSLQVKLQAGLTDKKFLLVLDDVWNRNYNHWDNLRIPFKGGLLGSKIIVTTRDHDVARMMAKEELIHCLDLIAENDCWLLFEKHAFENKDGNQNPKLEEIGKKVVKKCRGLPLAVKTVAGLLRSKTTEEEWEDILESEVWSQTDYQDGILPALRLSYIHLPSHLKKLRFLDLSATELQELPDWICTFYNLQTLLLTNCKKLKELPEELGKLINLCYLDISGIPLEKMPLQMSKLRNLQVLTTFLVGKDSGSMIEELGKLPELRGKLLISRLENVSSGRDASMANMKDKTQIEDLTLKWNADIDDSQVAREVLENLKPHSDIKHLKIDGYCRTTFPDWLRNPQFCLLESLSLSGCENCLELPALGQLQSLQSLEIIGMRYILALTEEFYGDVINPFQSLKKFRIKNMPKWEKWQLPKCEVFCKLEELCIINCPKLTGELPIQLSSLRRLEIHACDKLVLSNGRLSIYNEDIRQLSSLCELTIYNLTNLKELPTGLNKLSRLECDSCVNLTLETESYHGGFPPEILKLENCDSLKVVSLGSFPKLKSFEIWDCKSTEMLSIPPRGIGNQSSVLTSLQSLTIFGCDELMSFPKGGLPAPNLMDIVVTHCKKLKSLPDGMECLLPSLEYLFISYCPEIVCVPERGLPSSLKYLYIYNCKKLLSCRREWGLQRLPSLIWLGVTGIPEVESFPEEDWLLPCTLESVYFRQNIKTLNYSGLLQLTNLKQLSIFNCPLLQSLPNEGLPASLTELYIRKCPLLKPRLEGEKGQDWPKVAHIPCVIIDDELFP